MVSAPGRGRPALPPTWVITWVSGLMPYSASYSAATRSTASCTSPMTRRVSSRVAPSSMAKLPDTLPCSGESKNRHGTDPLISAAVDQEKPTMTSASTG